MVEPCINFQYIFEYALWRRRITISRKLYNGHHHLEAPQTRSTGPLWIVLPRAFPCVSSPLPPPFPLEISCYVFPCVRFRFPLGTPAALQTRQKRKEASASSMAPPSPPAATVADGRSNAPSTLFCSPRAFERARTNRTRRPIGHGVYIFNREENRSETTF